MLGNSNGANCNMYPNRPTLPDETHKCYFSVFVKGASEGIPVAINSVYYTLSSQWKRYSAIVNMSSASYFQLTDRRSSNWTEIYFKNNIMVIDLTKMFGSGNEPSVDEFERMFTNQYYPYCEGRLVSLGGYKIKWNQLIQAGNFPSNWSNYWTIASGTGSVSGGVITITVNESPSIKAQIYQQLSGVNGHVYYQAFTAKASVANSTLVNRVNTSYVNFNVGTSYVRTSRLYTHSGTGQIECNAQNNSLSNGDSFSVKDFIFIDLTEMFGPGSEPTLEEFEAMFGTQYSPYDAGTEMNVMEKMELDDDLAVKSTGFNIWDEQWRNGRYLDNGEYQYINECICCQNYMRVNGGETYRFTGGNAVIYCYDSNKTFIPYTGQTGSSVWRSGLDITNSTFILPSETRFIRFCMSVAYGTTYKNNICINLSDPSKNGTYVPYQTSTQDFSWIYDLEYTPEGSETPEKLFPYGLLSAGSVYDEVTETGAIKRVGAVDLGSLTWAYSEHVTGGTNDKAGFYSSAFPTGIKHVPSSSIPNAICCKYPITYIDRIYSGLADKSLSYSNGFTVRVVDSGAGTDKDVFTQAMSGVLLYYELATPITITFDSPKQLGYNVQTGGTEELLPTNPTQANPVTAPVALSVTYPLDAVGTISNLPKNYVSIETMDDFTSALASCLHLTISKVWQDNNNKWHYTINTNSQV